LIGAGTSLMLGKYTTKHEEKSPITKDDLLLMLYYTPAMIRRAYLFAFAIFLPIYASNTLHMDVSQVAKLFIITAVALTLLGPLSGRIVDKISARIVIVVGMMIMSVCSFLIFIGIDFFTAFYALLFCFGIILPAGMKYFADLIKDHKSRTHILGIAGTTTEIATIFMAILVPLIASINQHYVWALLSVLTIAGVLPFARVKK